MPKNRLQPEQLFGVDGTRIGTGESLDKLPQIIIMIKYANGNVKSVASNGNDVKYLCGKFTALKDTLRPFIEKRTKFLYADLTTGTRKQLTEGEFFS